MIWVAKNVVKSSSNGQQKLYTPANGWSFPFGAQPIFRGYIIFLCLSLSFSSSLLWLRSASVSPPPCQNYPPKRRTIGAFSASRFSTGTAAGWERRALWAEGWLVINDSWISTDLSMINFSFRHPSLPLIFFVREIGPSQFNTNRNRISYDASPQS